MRMIFVNLPVKDLPPRQAFFTGLGFEFNTDFSDDTAACMVVDQQHLRDAARRGAVPRLRHRRGRRRHARRPRSSPACPPTAAQQVDELVAKAIAAGGKPWQPVVDDGPMYGGSFQDLDGHVWELMHPRLP